MTTAIRAHPQLATVDEAADVLRVKPATVREMLRRDEIRGVRLGDGPRGRWRIPAHELERIARGAA